MVHCFLTGVQLRMEQAFVLNRREARDLLAALNDRVASLRRVIDQFGPLDDEEDASHTAHRQRAGLSRKRHRLVCHAVAEAMAPGFPEIDLFQTWPQHQAEVQAATQRSLRAHPVHGDAIQGLDEKAVREGDKLGRAVLRLLDPQRKLRQRTRLAICAATCVQLHGRPAEQVARVIRAAAVGADGPESVGLAPADLADVRALIAAEPPAVGPAPGDTPAGVKP